MKTANFSRDIIVHERFMSMAIKEAGKGRDNTYPNPLVGAVIVKGNSVVSKGYHKRFGGGHAEVDAIRKARCNLSDATLYVTLEPCSSVGKTPPCTAAILDSGIKEVICAMKDPNPANRGKGIQLLRENNLRVRCGILRKEAQALNADFVNRMKRNRPFVAVKMAQSLDGKIATKTGDSKWISSAPSRRIAHRLRSRHDAVMVGINTLMRDDPLLTNRAKTKVYQPTKVVVDSNLLTPLGSKILSRQSPAKTIIATTTKAPKKKVTLLKNKGVEVLEVRSYLQKVDLDTLLRRLAYSGIGSILVEGGGELAASLFKERLVDKVYFFVAPLIIGGRDSVTSVEGAGVKAVKDGYKILNTKLKKIGKDFLVEGDVYWHN